MNNKKLSEWTINVTFRLRFYRATVKNNKQQRQGYIYIYMYIYHAKVFTFKVSCFHFDILPRHAILLATNA